MIYSRLTGVGGYLPPLVCTNEMLRERGVDTTDEWIVQRTGIHQRHFAEAGVLTVDLAEQAARRALVSAKLTAKEVDLIIVATSTSDAAYPSVACTLQGRLDCAGAAFDVSAACSGFVYAMTVTDALLRSGAHRCALVVGAELNSRILDWKDRSTCVLFGDGAGAVVLTADNTPGILASIIESNGAYAKKLKVAGHFDQGRLAGDPFVRMNGSAVFKTAVRVLSEISLKVAQQANMLISEVDWFVPHQANIRIAQSVAEHLHVPLEKFVVTVSQHANTSSASIPLALDTAIKDGRIKHGHIILLHAVGGGFTWGGTLIRV